MNQKGFTMLELIFVLAIVGITASITVINLQHATSNYNKDTVIEEVTQYLKEARTEAIARNSFVDFACVDTTNNTYAIRELGTALSGGNVTYSTQEADIKETIAEKIVIGDRRVRLNLNNFNNTAATGYFRGVIFNGKGAIVNANTNPPVINIDTNINDHIVSPEISITLGTNSGQIQTVTKNSSTY